MMQEMKFVISCFFMVSLGVAVGVLQGCGKKASPVPICDTEELTG